jgi:hypothetical protein
MDGVVYVTDWNAGLQVLQTPVPYLELGALGLSALLL